MGLGLIGTAMAGAAVGLGTEGAKFMSATFLKEQEAEIQKLRDERIEEYAKGREQRGYEASRELVTHTEDVRTKRAVEAGKASDEAAKAQVDDLSGTFRAQTSGEQAASRASALRSRGMINEAMAVERGEEERGRHVEDRTLRREELQTRAAQDERQHVERIALLKKQLEQQSAQIGLEKRKVDMLETTNALDVKQKQAIEKAREAYMAETDADKKHEKGATYLTLLGKIGERYKELSETDAMGNKKTVGFFDTLSGKEVGRTGGKSTDAGGRPPLSSFGGQKEAPASAAVPAAAKPAAAPAATRPSDDEFNVMVRDAARGGTIGKQYLREKLESGLLNVRQRMAAQNALK